jgi:hypothetical protein
MKNNSKKVLKKSGTGEEATKLKRENHKLKAENKLLKELLKSNEGVESGRKTKGYSTRYSREI